MKNIAEIQAELQTITTKIESLCNDLQRMREKAASKKEENIYQKIDTIAAKYPIINDMLASSSDETKEKYLSMLSFLL